MRAVALTALLLLAACKPAPQAAPEPAKPAAPAPPGPEWRIVTTGSGSALSFGLAGKPVLKLSCLGAGVFVAQADGFTAIESEERMSVGAGDTVVVLVVRDAIGEKGVEASGPINGALLDAIAAGGKIAASYGDQTVGPFPAPAADLNQRFTDGCQSVRR